MIVKKDFFVYLFCVLLVLFFFIITINFIDIKNRYHEIEPNLADYATAEVIMLSFEKMKAPLLRSSENGGDEFIENKEVFKSKLKILSNKSELSDDFFHNKKIIDITNELLSKLNYLDYLFEKYKQHIVSKNEIMSFIEMIEPDLINLQEMIYEVQLTKFNDIKSIIVKNSDVSSKFAVVSFILLILIIFNMLSLQQIIKKKNIFISSIYHELSSSIQKIIIAADIVQYQLRKNNLYDEINVISKHAKKIMKQTKEILEYSKLEIGKIKVVKSSFSIDTFIHDVINDVTIINNNQIKLFNSYKNIKIISDKEKIYRILINLIENANKFTINGIIIINVKIIKNNLWIKVKDNGEGFDKKKIKYLFKAFNQGAEKNTRQGLGLGLTIVDNYIKILDGKIYIKSNRNIGSSFLIMVPIEMSKK
jgi:signal transduction histidine kinase